MPNIKDVVYARFRVTDLQVQRLIVEGYSICQRELPLNFKNLEERLLEELNRLRQLESSVDKALQSLAR